MRLYAPLIIALVLLVSGLAGCLIDNIRDENYEPVIYACAICGELAINESSTAILPAPMAGPGVPTFGVRELIVEEKGNVTYNHIETKYGLGIQFNFTQDFSINATSPWVGFSYFSLSVENITKSQMGNDFYGSHQFWAYSNFTSNGNHLNISIYCYDSNQNFYVDEGAIGSRLSGGWEKVTGSYRKMVT